MCAPKRGCVIAKKILPDLRYFIFFCFHAILHKHFNAFYLCKLHAVRCSLHAACCTLLTARCSLCTLLTARCHELNRCLLDFQIKKTLKKLHQKFEKSNMELCHQNFTDLLHFIHHAILCQSQKIKMDFKKLAAARQRAFFHY